MTMNLTSTARRPLFATVLDLPDLLIDKLSAGFDGASDKASDIEQFGRPRTPVFDLRQTRETTLRVPGVT